MSKKFEIAWSLEKYKTYCFSIFVSAEIFQLQRLQSGQIFPLNFDGTKVDKLNGKEIYFTFFMI